MEQETLEGLEEYRNEDEVFIFSCSISVSLPGGDQAELAMPPYRVEASSQGEAENKFLDLMAESSIKELIRTFIDSPPSQYEWRGSKGRGIEMLPRRGLSVEAYRQESDRLSGFSFDDIDLDDLEASEFWATVFDRQENQLDTVRGSFS